MAWDEMNLVSDWGEKDLVFEIAFVASHVHVDV